MMLVAVVLSFLVRPPDYALWLVAVLLAIFLATFFVLEVLLQISTATSLNTLVGLYVMAALGFGIRWTVKARQ